MRKYIIQFEHIQGGVGVITLIASSLNEAFRELFATRPDIRRGPYVFSFKTAALD